jgi:hypothetical protein
MANGHKQQLARREWVGDVIKRNPPSPVPTKSLQGLQNKIRPIAPQATKE